MFCFVVVVFFFRNPSLNSTAFCWHSQTRIWRSRKILCGSFSLKFDQRTTLSSRRIFSPNIAHHLVDLNTPFWIEMKVSEETVLTRWIEGGVHLSIMIQAYSYFYFFFFQFSLFTRSSYFVRQFRFSEAGSCLKVTLSHFKPREKSRLLIYLLLFILGRISPCRICCEIMAQNDAGELQVISILPRAGGFLFSEHC